ncbi:phosphatase [Sphingomonas sp.]|uniref:phosphatase n=1 Tax=Sphingomonas sp. TaxID=28214 RepID=UPI003CC6180D
MTDAPDPAADIRAAERRAAAAKERLTNDLHRLQVKLNPKALALDAARTAADRGQSAAESGLDYARANPAPVAGVVAVTGLFLFRKRIIGLFRRKKTSAARAQARSVENNPHPKDSDHD